MSDTNKHIITRLKLQPRHGAKKTTDISTDAGKVLGSFDDAFENLKLKGLSLTSVLGDVYDSLNELQTSTVSNVTGVNKLMGIYQQFSKILADQVDQTTKLFQRNNQLAKTFGLTEKASQKYGFQLDQINEHLSYGRTNIEKYVKGLKGLMGVQAINIKNDGRFGTSLLKTQRYMTDLIGVSEEAAEGMRYYNAAAAGFKDANGKDIGKDIESRLNQERESAKLIAEQLGLTTDMNEQTALQQEIMESIGDLAPEIQMQYGRYPATLGLAVMKAKQLGISMEQLNKTGESLLNIESSVGDELEYQLLSGKRLVDNQGKSLTNMYREAALSGEANKKADVMEKILDTQGETLNTNVLARKQLAKTLGMEEDTLARMLQKRKLLSDIGAKSLFGKSGEDLKKELENLQKQGKVGKDQIDEIMKNDDMRDAQTRMAEALEAIQTRGIVAQFPGGGTEKFIEAFKGVTTSLNNMTTKFGLAMTKPADKADIGGGYFVIVDKMKDAIGSMSTFRTSINGLGDVITKMSTQIPIWGTKLSGLATTITDSIAQGLGTNLEDMTIDTTAPVEVNGPAAATGNDAIIMNDGIVRFNPRDKFTRVNDGTMIAGTNVDGNRRLARQLSGGGGISDNQISRLASAIASALKETLPTVKMSVTSDPLFAANKLNRGRYS